MRTLAILPVKAFSQAKQRLRHGLPDAIREALVEAMLADVLGALRLTAVDRVLVVTAAEAPRRIAQAHGARVLADEEAGHNPAVALGIGQALSEGFDRALLVPGDCPALDPAEVDELLAHPASTPSVLVVPDRHGTGTNALLLTPPDSIPPSFGPGSCERHLALAQARGVAAEVVRLPSLALDIDTPEDLEALAGSSTRAQRTHGILARC
ncbi:MAG TPA: 2-phospho-L-lactate guanylyltransferase [Solirubrobacteraceae bacterium]|nr:2-phospho-L-lactate guanylyltransferase [Solirubrobacteraceae bacterium]